MTRPRRPTGANGVAPIRPNMPPAFGRATKREKAWRVQLVAELLCAGHCKAYIKRFCRQFFDIGPRGTEAYLALARERLRDATGEDREFLVAQSFALYMSIVGKESASIADKLTARRAADRLLGLIAPAKVAPTTPAGGPPAPRMTLDEVYKAAYPHMTPEERIAAESAMARLRELEREHREAQG